MMVLDVRKRLEAPDGFLNLDIQCAFELRKMATIFGKSGAGKTSILRMIAGLMRPDEGQITCDDKIWFDHQAAVNERPQRRNIGFVFQDDGLFPNMTVDRNINYAMNGKVDRDLLKELIDTFELGSLQSKRATTLSRGQKQRVMLAQALAKKPALLLLDEPFSALDEGMRTKMQDYIRHVQATSNLTTILVSHDVKEVIRLSDKVYMLEDGIISRYGHPAELFFGQQGAPALDWIGEIVQMTRQDQMIELLVLVTTGLIKVQTSSLENVTLGVGDKIRLSQAEFNPTIEKLQ